MRSGVATAIRSRKQCGRVTFGGSGVVPKGTKYKCSAFNVETKPKCLETTKLNTDGKFTLISMEQQ